MKSQGQSKHFQVQEDSGGLAAGGILIAALLGQAIYQNNGAFSTIGILFVAIAICVSAVSVFKSGDYTQCISITRLCSLLAVILGIQFVQLVTTLPGIYIHASDQGWIVFSSISVCAAFLTATCLTKEPVFGRYGFALVFGAFVFLALWVLYFSPSPKIDVYYFQRDSVAKLLRFENPYAYGFNNIYSHEKFYGEGLVRNGVLQFGYPYFPLALVAAIPGYLLGDIRFVMVLAIGCTGLMFASLQSGALGRGLAALYWFNPRTLFIIEQSWIEPLIVFCAVLMVFLITKHHKLACCVAGLLLASKQTMIWMPFLLPLLFIGNFKNWRRAGLVALLIAAATCVPFFLWDPNAFWSSVISLQFAQPFRPDALSLPAFFNHIGINGIHWALAFPASLVCIAFSLWRSARTVAGWAMATCLTYLVFFACNKQAFCNYYFMIIGFACLVASTVRLNQNEPEKTFNDEI